MLVVTNRCNRRTLGLIPTNTATWGATWGEIVGAFPAIRESLRRATTRQSVAPVYQPMPTLFGRPSQQRRLAGGSAIPDGNPHAVVGEFSATTAFP
jgi:hypothetical protein